MGGFLQGIMSNFTGSTHIAKRRSYAPYSQLPNEDTEDSDVEMTPKRIIPARTDYTPFPLQQVVIILILALVEPINFAQRAPNIPQIIQDLGITGNDKRKVGYYSGMIETSYSLVEGIFILHWSRTSDRIGRRFVLLFGVAGIGLSALLFGLSNSFLGLLFSNALGGALNANWAVTRSAMADILDNATFARTIVWQPVMWSTGTVIGSLMGGSFSHPYEKYPSIFGNNKLWQEYPYFLPCLLASTIAGIALLIGFLFLRETLPPTPAFKNLEEYELVESRGVHSPTHSLNGLTSTEAPLPLSPKAPPLKSLLTWPMIFLLINYSNFCFHEIFFSATTTLFLSSPQSAGGLDFTSDKIGVCLAFLAVYNSLFQIFVFRLIEGRWGSTKMIRVAMLAWAVEYALFPVNAWMAKSDRVGVGAATTGVLVIQGLVSPFAFSATTCFAISLTVVTPPSSYGAANGIMQSSAAIARIITPTAASSLFAFSVEKNILDGNFVYYIGISVALIGYLMSGYLSPVEATSNSTPRI